MHSYAYLARKALTSYHSRLKSVVFENAFVIQVRGWAGSAVQGAGRCAL